MTFSPLTTNQHPSVFTQITDGVAGGAVILERPTSLRHDLQKDPTPTDMSANWRSSTLEPMSTPRPFFLESQFRSVPPSDSSLTIPPGSFSSNTPVQPGGVPAAAHDHAPDVIAYVGGVPITESSICTHELAGTTKVDVACISHEGKTSFMFVFSVCFHVLRGQSVRCAMVPKTSGCYLFRNLLICAYILCVVQDLSVKKEGTFALRYRVFDIFAAANDAYARPALAECFGGTFRIYSAKEFPGLSSSTDLTKVCFKQLSRLVQTSSRQVDCPR